MTICWNGALQRARDTHLEFWPALLLVDNVVSIAKYVLPCELVCPVLGKLRQQRLSGTTQISAGGREFCSTEEINLVQKISLCLSLENVSFTRNSGKMSSRLSP